MIERIRRKPWGSAGWGEAFWGSAAALLAVLSGCAVPQRPGLGKEYHLQEPQTRAWYWLYLPMDYLDGPREGAAPNRKVPLVMTFHGMKPFDNAHSQCREWQQEADRYGLVVCAPELLTPDISSPLPLKRVVSSLERDERAILAIMDELLRSTDVDPNTVLATCWSYGGYIAHYMVNRHPERFTCLAAKQSNFSADLLDPKNVPRYRDYKVAVFYTENDFAICQRESQEAAIWYSRHGFDLTFAEFGDKGHERTPSLAAAFFARASGIPAKTPPQELGSLRVKQPPVLDRAGNKIAGVEPMPGDHRPQPQPPGTQTPRKGTEADKATVAAAESPYRQTAGEAAGSRVSAGESLTGNPPSSPPWRHVDSGSPLRTRPLAPNPAASPNPQPSPPPPANPEPQGDNPVRVRLSSTIGIAPLVVSYSAALPDHLRRKAYYLWTDNDEPVSNGVNGQIFLTTPGEHRLEVLVTTEDGQEYRAWRSVTVLERITTSRQSH